MEIVDKMAEKTKESEQKRIELEDKKYDLTQTLLEFEKYKNNDDYILFYSATHAEIFSKSKYIFIFLFSFNNSYINFNLYYPIHII